MVHFETVSKVHPRRGGDVRALDDVSFRVEAGECVVIQGPSGGGKSTLLLGAGGMQRPTSGTIRVAGQSLYELPPAERARFRAKHLGFVFQMFHLIPYLDVRDNVLLAADASGLDRNAATRRAEQLLGELGLAPRLRHRPADLSTGERQRAALARALLNQPKLLLADEPTGNLDPETAAHVHGELLRLIAEEGLGALVATHNLELAKGMSRIARLERGRIV